ncbi:MAG TPA: right-handed parallel beta-helix repeat-containing protein, partial [Adhaeribacter sp.]|nr:right-handed parallel beta-helix repeat-containing protein [Adhaeribacter sp.]
QKINGAPNISVANGWTSLGSATFAGQSPASTSPVVQTIPVNLNLVMQPQDTFGFFIQWTGNVFPTTNTNIPTFTNGTVTIIADAKSAFTGTGTTPTFNPRQINGGVIYSLNAPCTAPPTAGTTVASVSAVCPNTNFQLSLNGASMGTGLTFQWQSSPNGTTGWTNIAGATNSTLTTSQVTTSFYRAQLTCSGQTASSTPIQVTTSATPVSGTFTIDKGNPASATNFTSFADAITFFECGGVNGPIVFNVAANSGPYNEQIVLPFIPGASATNTITFNGNGNTISGAPAAPALGLITLDGADYAKFDNFVLTLPASTTTGWGVQLINQADNNTITNTTINLPQTVTGTTVNGIIAGTAVGTAGTNGSNNIFSNNTINGGYYGIRLNGSGTTGAVGNQIINNTIKDTYAYNIYLFNADNSLVEGNNISRPTRGSVTSFYGITLGGTSKSNTISKNRIHNTHGGASSLTGLVYGLYSTSNDAPVGSENVFKNNLIYNINNTGTIYGIYNTGSDGAHYFHNTIDHSNASSTGTVRGIYQTTAATNLKFQNNIVSVDGGASGTKHVLYYGTTTSAITSDNNVLYATGGANLGSWGTANQPTLAAWRTASSKDANSVSADPQYLDYATGNLKPTSVAVNDIGTPVGVTDDITGAVRSTTTPDPGAYEFTVNP